MNKLISLLTVTVRSSFYKICLILLAMSTLQLGMFWRTYLAYDYSQTNSANVIVGEELPGQAYGVEWTLESLVEKSKVSIVFMVAFALICLVLYWAEGERKGTHISYFYDRLTVSNKERIVGFTLYNMVCILLLVFAEVLTVLGMGMIFVYLVPAEYESVQMYFMAFYKSEFLHCLFPMADIFKWIRNIFLFASCALEIGACSCRKRKSWSLFLIIVLTVLGFVQEIGTFGAMDAIMIIMAGIYIVINVCQVWYGGAEDDI
jgi:hypothetical protein